MSDINEYDHSHEAAVMGGSRFLGMDNESLLKRIERAKVVPDISGYDVVISSAQRIIKEQKNDSLGN